MLTRPRCITEEINANGHRLETVSSFKYLGSVITDEGAKPQVLKRLKPVWKDNNVALGSKIRLMLALDMSTYVYDCELNEMLLTSCVTHTGTM